MNQLLCADLKGGDILLKVSDGSIFSKVISLSERLRGQLNPLITHAGVMFDKTYIIEALEHGISGSDLRVQDRAFGYMVYRPAADFIARGAATCAKMMFDIHQTNGTMKYNFPLTAIAPGGMGKPKTSGTMDRLLDGFLNGRGHRLYCSQFVVYTFQFVAEQNNMPPARFFNANDARVSPSNLASLLQANPNFREAGYLMPNQR